MGWFCAARVASGRGGGRRRAHGYEPVYIPGARCNQEGERKAKSQSIGPRALFARGLTLIPICRSDWIGRPRIGFPFHNPL